MIDEEPSQRATDRVWRSMPAEARASLEHGLSPTDLQTLLLSVARSRAKAVTPARLMQRWREDRFVHPSTTDPIELTRLELRLWAMLPETFQGVELSPVTPLGTCSAVAPVDQHRVVSTIRGTEVVSDPTNVLATEAATRRGAQQADERVDLAAAHRVLRGQLFRGPGVAAHFRLFVLVSSARDTGSARTEARMLIDHMRFWAHALGELVPTVEIELGFTAFGSGPVAERLRDSVLPAVASTLPANVSLGEDPTRTHGAGYYTDAALSISAREGDSVVNLGDGGLTRWTAALMGDAKERCLTSCIATERLLRLLPRTVSP